MVEKEILIRKATSDDLEDIYYLYENFMFDSFFLNFGNSFVKKYLEIILNSNNCITLVAEEGSRVGFIMATPNSKKTLSQILLNMEMLRLWVVEIFRRPSLVLESLEFAFYPFYTSLTDVNAELLFIAIDPAYRLRGLADKLITRVLALLRQKNIDKVKVSTLARNEAVNSLLKKKGFEVRKKFRLFRKDIYLYSFSLD